MGYSKIIIGDIRGHGSRNVSKGAKNYFTQLFKYLTSYK